ncbi:MAG TPA: SDR family oxidoreductase, partial [Terriglobia bacterium]|nr:SDR family oxidoreductase [Terriglobia bacterium]
MKTLILAGGSGGLGAVVARMASARGYKPVIGYRANHERAHRLATELGVAVVPGDIADEGVRMRLIEAARQSGELYGLAVLTGDPARVPIEKASMDDLLNSMRVNFAGPVLLARDFAAALGDGDGSIVLTSTMQGVGVFPGSTVYAAPKAALIHTARILARQWKIRVNVVAPGVNNAGMAEQSVQSGKYNSFLERHIIPRWG